MQIVYQSARAPIDAVRLDPRPGEVVGRDELITEVRTRLLGNRGTTVVALTGLGGVGKTTTALEYAHRNIDAYRVVWQFHAQNATELLAQFHDLAQLLSGSAVGDPVAAVHAALANHTGPWLVILDNIRDHATARRWIPAKGDGHVLVTTQDGAWPASQTLQVTPIEPQAAVDFLLDSAQSTDHASAEAIARELGLLPLALAQAAAFVQTTGRTLADYLRLLRSDHAAVLARGAPAAHATPVVATWSLALSELAATTPGSVALLRIAAFLSADAVPFRLLFDEGFEVPEPADDPEIAGLVRSLCRRRLAIDDAVTGLRRYSLITPPSDTFSVHRLVQAATRDELTTAQRRAWRSVAVSLIENAIPQDVRPRAVWPTCRLLLPHANLVADPLGAAAWRLAEFLGASGDYATARAQWDFLARAFVERLGPEHPRTLAARANLAHWAGEAGDAVAARDALGTLVSRLEQISGPEATDTLAARADLAWWTGMTGNRAAARDLMGAQLPIRERVSGPEHPDTLRERASHARWTGSAGDAAQARDLLNALLPVRVRVSGVEHPETLVVRSQLARWTGLAGEAATARDMFAELVAVRQRILGPEHPHTLAATSRLAYWTGAAGDPATARDMYAAMLSVHENVLGPEHPTVLAERADYARWTGEAGNAQAARDLYRTLSPTLERAFAPDHPEALATRGELARWTALAGDVTSARALYGELLRAHERVYGPDHPKTAALRADTQRWMQ
jgi:Tetratricopeptide repeat